ncbi:MAG: TfoX/Sxy family protein [Gammaproteobacteria bacterium]|nr:TfoX/Sxy family protein [Gammaproteobacteria bacterium]
MSASTEYTEYILELLTPLGPTTTGRFFGGVGLARNGVQFAILMGNSLYFVVDDTTREKYTAAGMTCFSYLTKKGRVQVRKYFELPEDALTDPAQLRQWANEAMRVAGKTKQPGKVR